MHCRGGKMERTLEAWDCVQRRHDVEIDVAGGVEQVNAWSNKEVKSVAE